MAYNEDTILDIVDYAEGRYASVDDFLTDVADRNGMFYNEPELAEQVEAAIEDDHPVLRWLEEGIARMQDVVEVM